MHTIEDTIQIAATPTRILEALTTKEGIKGWWTLDVACDSEKKQATYRFPQKAGGAMEVTFQLLSADAAGLVMKCVAQNNNPDWLNTTLAFKLVPDGTAVTRVDLSHAGYPAKNELHAMCVKGWAHYLRSLKSYIETGTGEPHGKA